VARAYDPQTIETKWQERWQAEQTFRAGDTDDPRPKKYVLDMFPYPSGDGLHLGHVENYAISDVLARYARHQGFNVLHPMGWDAFGLPAEQYAIEHQVHPRDAVERNVAVFRGQMQRMGFSYDWSREIDSTHPDYYRWTQWIFLKLREKGLAYVDEVPVNWCEALGTVLANEEVVDGLSERGNHPVVRKPMRQWLLRITEYADRLLEDLDDLDWPEHLKKMQREWIGRSTGTEVDFAIDEAHGFTVFTTRPDTLFGATFCVLAPEHALVDEITSPEQAAAVADYLEQTTRRSERERIADTKSKTGVWTGAFATNPVNGERLPVWIADYVLVSYGTGAVMAVPGHDQRDYEFAQAFDLPIREVVSGGDLTEAAYEGEGALVNSGLLDGLSVTDAKERITAWLEERGLGRARVQYRLRDWLFSRQRYWGEPFPILYREDGSIAEVPASDLPVRLPEVESYKPTGTGESPLAAVPEWVNTVDPADGTPARRETNTMPQWAGSCWYYLRFADPHNQGAFCSPANEAYWLPVDTYIGGAEHAVLHLLYARFWHKVLFDLGLVHTKEPFRRLVNQGMILAPSYRDGSAKGRYLAPEELEFQSGHAFVKGTGAEAYSVVEKMGKSKKNVVNPDDIVKDLGADTLRLYILFMGPPEGDKLWDASGIQGVSRFLQKAWRLILGDERHEARPRTQAAAEGDARHALHTAIAGITADMEALGYNTAISKLMILLSAMTECTALPEEMVDAFLRMLSPFAPHIAEEMWAATGREGFVSTAAWPTYEEEALKTETEAYAVQINGKVRGHLTVPAETPDEDILAAARALENVAQNIEGKRLVKQMVVRGRLVVLVAR
jgi:leucyl-tRNA synthetase